VRDFGYLLIVNNDKDGKYMAMAHLLASSIKRTQPTGYDKVCLIIDDNAYAKNKDIMFDKIIIKKDNFVGWDQRNFMIDYSPYTHTVCLDVDMFFTRDISHWIDYFVNKSKGLVVTSNVLKFNNEPITNLKCRPGYKENNLPVLYSGFTYFNKSSAIAQNFFKVVKAITKQKDIFKRLYMSKKYPPEIGTDEAFSIAAKILGVEKDISGNTSFPKFVHLKSELQDVNIDSIGVDLGYYIDKNINITIGTFTQNEIIHYSEKDLPMYDLAVKFKSLMLEGIKNV